MTEATLAQPPPPSVRLAVWSAGSSGPRAHGPCQSEVFGRQLGRDRCFSLGGAQVSASDEEAPSSTWPDTPSCPLAPTSPRHVKVCQDYPSLRLCLITKSWVARL